MSQNNARELGSFLSHFCQSAHVILSSASVLNTFVYDPLVEWSKPAKGKSSQTVGVAKNKAVSVGLLFDGSVITFVPHVVRQLHTGFLCPHLCRLPSALGILKRE